MEIKLLAVPPSLSLLGTHLRFEEMKAQESSGRMVGKEVHDQKYQQVAPTLYSVQSAALYNKLQIYGRSVEPIEGSHKLGVYLIATNPPNPLQLFQEEVDRKWSPDLKSSFDQGVQKVIRLMKARQASDQETATFLKDIYAEYPTQNELQLQTEQQIKEYAITERINDHKADQLPTIDINGTNFTIDLRLQELRETDQPANRIYLHEMQAGRRNETYLFFYHTQKHKVYDPPVNIKSLPKNVVVVEIPVEARLDPIATAQILGADVEEFVKANPIQIELTAIVKPLSQSMLPELVRQNLDKKERLQQQKGQNHINEDLDQGYTGPRMGR